MCVRRLNISWYCGYHSFIGVVSYGGYWYSCVVVSSSCEAGRVSALVVLSVGFSSSCEAGRVSALVVLIVVASSSCEAGRVSALVVLIVVGSSSCEAGRVSASACRADCGWILLLGCWTRFSAFVVLSTVVSRLLRSLTSCGQRLRRGVWNHG